MLLNFSEKYKNTYIIFSFFLLLNVLLWTSLRHVQIQWSNVPSAPSKHSAVLTGLGDSQFSYRIYGLLLQNLGDNGGQTTALYKYNYKNLSDWFYLMDNLDAKSDYIPFLAAYYFSGIQAGYEFKLKPLILYLDHVGKHGIGQKWRWMAQAVYLANFKLHNKTLALRIAQDLQSVGYKKLPIWSRQLPVLLLADRGDKEAAYNIVMNILKTEAENLHPNEVNYYVDYICNRLLSSEDATINPLCIEENN